MTHDELLNTLNSKQFIDSRTPETPYFALRAVVELHKPDQHNFCFGCSTDENGIHDTSYPCPTIQAIEKELG